jgi:hypothetical protein
MLFQMKVYLKFHDPLKSLNCFRAHGSLVVKALSYEPEGRGFKFDKFVYTTRIIMLVTL